MSLRKLLYFDLGRLLPWRKGRPAAPEPELHDLWFMRLFTRRHKWPPARRPAWPRAGEISYEPGAYYRRVSLAWRAGWPGPSFFRMRLWQQDLLRVMSELTAIVRINASLPRGLEAAAREENRLSSQWGSQRIRALAPVVFWSIVIVVLFIQFAASPIIEELARVVRTFLWSVNLYEAELLILTFLGLLVFLVAFLLLRLLFRTGAREAVLLVLRDDLLAGMQLSEAMRRLPRFFPAFYADLVRAGEESGNLAHCLEQLSEDTLDAITMRARVRQQVAYLGTVFVIQACIIAFLLAKVIPVFGELLADFGEKLPVLMQTLIATGDFVYYHLYALVSILAVVIVYRIKVLVRHRRSFAAKPLAGPLMLVPGLRSLIVQQNTATVSFMLEKLLRAGAPLPAAIESAARADMRPSYRRMLRRIHGRVSQGVSLAEACAFETWLLPASFRAFVAIGERSGMLPDALATLAAQYRERAERRVRVIVDLITPMGVLALGGLTLAFEASLFVTLTAMVDSLIP